MEVGRIGEILLELKGGGSWICWQGRCGLRGKKGVKDDAKLSDLSNWKGGIAKN